MVWCHVIDLTQSLQASVSHESQRYERLVPETSIKYGLHCIMDISIIYVNVEWQRTLSINCMKVFYRELHLVDCIWNVMAHEQKPDFVFHQNRWVHLNRWGRQFSRLLAAEVRVSAVVLLDTPCSEVVWRVLATHSICQFPLHFPSRASPYATTF